MVRAGVPIPVGYRMRLMAQNMRRLHPARSFNGQPALILEANKTESHEDESMATASPPFEFTEDPLLHAIVNEFIHKYDDLISLLCYTAQEGVDFRRRERYSELRSWFLLYYDRVRPVMLSQLDATGFVVVHHSDSFEALFETADLGAIVDSDTIMDCMICTRSAVEKCRTILGTRIY